VLSQNQSLSRASYLADRENRDVVERQFVKLTDATLDITKMIIVHEKGTSPKRNPASMVEMDAAGLFDQTAPEEMVQAARFRNMLAHTYSEAINHDDVYQALQDLNRYQNFLIDVGRICMTVVYMTIDVLLKPRAITRCSKNARSNRSHLNNRFTAIPLSAGISLIPVLSVPITKKCDLFR